MEIQQSPLYGRFIHAIGWKSEAIDSTYIFSKHIPLFLSLAKIYRFTKLPDIDKVISYLTKEKIKKVAVEPDSEIDVKKYTVWLNKLKKHFQIYKGSFLPTKTIRVDLTPSVSDIFNKFTEAKRRAVRRAQKNNIVIKESTNINELIAIKNKSGGIFGFITTYGIDKLWPIFQPDNSAILLAYSSNTCIGGILLLYWDNVAYYWIAGATKQGKKLFAPTLLVWEALKVSKKRGCKEFDFVGVWDERLPNYYTEWKGFTKFKEGFGGKELYYPINTNGT